MDVMTHSSNFLLPSRPTDNGPSLSYALVVLNQPLPRFTPLLWELAPQRCICADGGANRLYDEFPQLFPHDDPFDVRNRVCNQMVATVVVGILPSKDFQDFEGRYKPDVIKGDMDSIREEVLDFYRNLGTKILDESQDQETTDLHKCVTLICEDTPTVDKSNLCILVAGALGGRFDHEAGNINVLCCFSTVRIILLSDDCLIQLLPSTHRHVIQIQSSVEGPHCGLIPIGMSSKSTTTTGLKWNLENKEMRFGGVLSTSNIVKEEKITVQSDSDLLWTISIKKPSSADVTDSPNLHCCDPNKFEELRET